MPLRAGSPTRLGANCFAKIKIDVKKLSLVTREFQFSEINSIWSIEESQSASMKPFRDDWRFFGPTDVGLNSCNFEKNAKSVPLSSSPGNPTATRQKEEKNGLMGRYFRLRKQKILSLACRKAWKILTCVNGLSRQVILNLLSGVSSHQDQNGKFEHTQQNKVQWISSEPALLLGNGLWAFAQCEYITILKPERLCQCEGLSKSDTPHKWRIVN